MFPTTKTYSCFIAIWLAGCIALLFLSAEQRAPRADHEAEAEAAMRFQVEEISQLDTEEEDDIKLPVQNSTYLADAEEEAKSAQDLFGAQDPAPVSMEDVPSQADIAGDLPGMPDESDADSEEPPVERLETERIVLGRPSDKGLKVPAYKVSNLSRELVERLIASGHLRVAATWTGGSKKTRVMTFPGTPDEPGEGHYFRTGDLVGWHKSRVIESFLSVVHRKVRLLYASQSARIETGLFASDELDAAIYQAQARSAGEIDAPIEDLVSTIGPLEITGRQIRYIVEFVEFRDGRRLDLLAAAPASLSGSPEP